MAERKRQVKDLDKLVFDISSSSEETSGILLRFGRGGEVSSEGEKANFNFSTGSSSARWAIRALVLIGFTNTTG